MLIFVLFHKIECDEARKKNLGEVGVSFSYYLRENLSYIQKGFENF